jgi:hypothetical protein
MGKLTFGPLILITLLALPVAVLAHDGPPQTFTDTVKQTDTAPSSNPCTGDPGTLSVTYNGVFHVTQFADGHYHLTGTQTGAVEFDTTDPTKPDYAGHLTLWFGENGNPNGFNATFTLNGQATGTDGSIVRFHQTAHVTIVGTEVIVQFDTLSCG